MKVQKLVLSVVCVGCALVASAFTEVKWKAAQDGSFTDPTMWNKEGGPVSGVDRAVLDLDANYTVTFPQEATSVAYSICSKTPYNNSPTDNKRLTLDFKGPFTFLDDLSKDVYEGEPFKFYSNNGHFFNWENWNTKYGPAEIDGTKVQLWVDKDGAGKYATHITVSGGSFKMREDHDDGKQQHGKLVLGHTVPDNNKLDVVFTDGGESRFCNVDGRFRGALTRYIVEKGAQNYVHNDFHLPSVSEENDYTNELIVRGKGTYMQVGNMCTANGSVPNRHLNTVVTNGATLKINDYRVNNAGHVNVLVADDGLLQINGLGGNFLKAANSDTTFTLGEGGTLEFTGNVNWGTSATADNCTAKIAYDGGAVKNSGNLNWSRDLPYTPGFKVVNNANWWLASDTIGKQPITMDISDGDISGTGGINAGNKCPLVLIATNATKIVQEASYSLNLGQDYGGDTTALFGGRTEVRLGGRLTVGSKAESSLTIADDAKVDAKEMYIGYDAKAPGTLLLKDNAWLRVREGSGSEVGGNANATVTIRDNAVWDCGYTRLGRATNFTKDAENVPETVINVEGGRLVCTNSSINVCDNARPATINLVGGEACVVQMMGWGWSRWAQPEYAGWSKFVGNGGTLRAFRSNDNFFGRFDEARIGAKGLVISSDYQVKVWQQFDNIAGESGVLTFSGAGLKLLQGTTHDKYTPGRTTVDRTVVAGGTVRFEKDADWNTHLVVTNNAVASFKGDNKGMTLKGLTLGDETTAGVLELDVGDVITVNGPVSLPNGRLAFTSTPGNAAYGVLKVLDPDVNFPEAQRVQWERMILSAGHQDGHSYIYTEETDASGALVLTLTVGDPVDLTDDVEWTAQDGTWATGENWSTGEKPGDLANAVVNKAAAIALETDETVGALTLGGDVTIAGEGSLGFTDSGNAKIKATAGTTAIDAGIFAAFPLPVETSEGAKVALNGMLKAAGFEKRGDGNLTLAQPTIEGLTVKDGVITFAGAAAQTQTVSKLTLDAAEAKRQVGIKADVPVTVTEIVPTKGLIVKAGAESLTIESDKALNLCPAEGPSGNNSYSTDYVFSETGPVTQAGAAVVVTEGNLTLKGTGDKAGTTDAPIFQSVHNFMIGVREKKEDLVDPSVTLDGIRMHADKHTRIGAGYDKTGASWKTATLNVDNGTYARFDTVHVGDDIGSVDLDNPPVVNINVDHGSSIQGWYIFNLNQSGYDGRRPKALVNVRFDHGSSYVDYNGNNGLKFNNPGIDVTFDNGSVFGRTTTDWKAASIPGQLTFDSASFDNHLRFLNGSTFMCDKLYLNATADWATNWLHFADSEWTAGDADFDFVFKNGNRLVFAAEGAGLMLNPPTERTWTMHSILAGTDVVKGGAGTLVFDRAKYLDNSTDLAKIKDNPKTAATLAITGTLRVNEGTVKIADAAAAAGTCALAVAADATVDLGGNKVAFTGLSGAGKVTNGSVEGLTYAYGDKVPTFDGLTGSVKVDFGGAAELKTTYVVGHYTGAAPTALTVKAINTGLSSVKAVATFENGDIKVDFQRSGLTILIY